MSATSERCRIIFECEKIEPGARSDATLLRTILVNLLGNAVKYSPAGTDVELRLSREGADAIFTVRDHGSGVPPEELPRLFSSFHRGRGTEGIPGTGLGLAIVKRCAEALGGAVTAHNAEGGGAEFTVRLPLFTAEKNGDAAAASEK